MEVSVWSTFEIGIGNSVCSTETENKDGTEFEERVFIKNLFIWIIIRTYGFGKLVLIFDTKEGFKKDKRERLRY